MKIDETIYDHLIVIRKTVLVETNVTGAVYINKLKVLINSHQSFSSAKHKVVMFPLNLGDIATDVAVNNIF